jgi:ABC-type sugar transport system ATPase subunit
MNVLTRAFTTPDRAQTATTAAGAAAADSTGAWRLRGLGKAYGSIWALQDLSLSIGEGEVVAVTGPSGAGKSTLGRLISGLEAPSAGEITVDGHRIEASPARLRRVAHMFESFALYPTRTVAQNVASPLEAPASAGRFDASAREQRIAEVLALTEMSAYRARLPSQLSGGQKQRVALCRALVQDPSIFVLDEPIGHLDARLRHHLRGEIRHRQSRLRQGTLWLTPDGIEALAVADRVVVLIGGRVQQIGTPEAVFARPANVAVARLIGDPAMNVLQASLQLGERPALQLDGAAPVPVTPAFLERFAPLAHEGRLLLGLRPSDLHLLSPEAEKTEGRNALHGTVYAVEPLGKQTLVTVDLFGQHIRVKTGPLAAWSIGDAVQIAFDTARALSFDADSGLLHD